MKQLKLVTDETMSEEKRQHMLIQLKVARKRAKLDGIENINSWIMSTDSSSIASADKEKQRQRAIAKARLEAAHRRRQNKTLETVEEVAESFDDKISNEFAKANNAEIDMIAKISQTGTYKTHSEKTKEELAAEIKKTDDLEQAIVLRLAYLSKDNEDPSVVLVEAVTERQTVMQEQILKSYSGQEIIEQIEKQKFEAIKYVVYAENSNELIEQELKEKYNEIRRLQAEESIVEEVTDSVWQRQSEEDQKIIIDEVCASKNIEDGIKKSKKVQELAKLAKKSDLPTEQEKRESKAKRQNILKNLDKNYDKELDAILGRIGSMDDKKQTEKARQLAMMKLRRERQNLKHENLGYEANKFTREMTMIGNRATTEQARQRQLAMEKHKLRLAARAKMNESEKEEEVKEKIDNIFDEEKLKENMVEAEVNSEMTLIEQVMNNLDLLHKHELTILESLFFTVIDNEATFEQAVQMSNEDLEKRLARYQQKRNKYFSACIEEEMVEHLMVKNVTQQMELMAKVTMLKMVTTMKTKKVDRDEASVELTSLLRSVHKFVTDNVEIALEEENDDDILTELVKVLIRARNEFWSPNITTVLLYPVDDTSVVGKQLAQQWLVIAKKQLRREIGSDLMGKKLAKLREESRQKQGINEAQLGQYNRMKTVIQTDITKEDEDALVAKLKRDLANEERRSRMARNTYREKLQQQLMKARESKLAAEEKQAEDLTAIMRDHTIFIERDADRRAKQKLQLTEVITRRKREKTMVLEQQRQTKTFIDRQENEDMDSLAAKLQKEALEEKSIRESKAREQESIQRENTDEALKQMTDEVIDGVNSMTIAREKTFARRERKKSKKSRNSKAQSAESPEENKTPS